ncbi:hypothetical protein A3C26_02545 [Candidatus Daviesbacteria bacterium RIFCSPHIGHO2_02_FULL_39_12]|uniref:DUF948 domain-containing protein n=2 Tax=Candidatus Daviesiibacteriota TaxID=1752718 RepID=A0A1F5J9U8_9BACT|nr:MAG: hypothetical protein A3C26_02545 [Candidatus Daviesbacteria bacterium RIFCSPHIGHO2_02_FULL_39_12]OGE71489.1 MAG: hypothetical protein A3H40_03110 [Candidatus Daviesbacteria bacterium RIFCSPLOWO2_02_FULL_38_15]
MDLLQAALIFLILLLSIFLAITGFQVFLILRDLKKGLDRFNNVLKSGENMAEDLEKPVASTAEFVTSLTSGAETVAAKVISEIVKRNSKPSGLKQKRFYKRTL